MVLCLFILLHCMQKFSEVLPLYKGEISVIMRLWNDLPVRDETRRVVIISFHRVVILSYHNFYVQDESLNGNLRCCDILKPLYL